MKIIINQEPPPELVRIAEAEYSGIEAITAVIFDINIERCKGDVAGLDPETGEVFIDLAACVNHPRWVNQGMMFIPSVWFNMLYGIYHEAAHAKQIGECDALKDLDHAPAILENAAHKEAIDKMFDWTESGFLPPISQMGWAAKEIRRRLNGLYAEYSQYVSMEIDSFNGGGVAEVNILTANRNFTKEEYDSLCEAIDTRDLGLKVGELRFINMQEFLGLDYHYSAADVKAAQTGYQEE